MLVVSFTSPISFNTDDKNRMCPVPLQDLFTYANPVLIDWIVLILDNTDRWVSV